jgi:hypothetical protein
LSTIPPISTKRTQPPFTPKTIEHKKTMTIDVGNKKV